MFYKFRAETKIDADEFFETCLCTNIKFIPDELGFPDVEVEMESSLSLQEIKNKMREVQDGHVMVETVCHASDYTGERDYDDDE